MTSPTGFHHWNLQVEKEMIHSEPMEYTIEDIIRVVATELQRMEEYGLRCVAKEID